MEKLSGNAPEIRCHGRKRNGEPCKKMLARGIIESGEVEFLCPRCGTYLILRATRPNCAPHDGLPKGAYHASDLPLF